MGHPLLKLFAFDHLPERLQAISRPFAELANTIAYGENAMGSATNMRLTEEALMKLWETKNLVVLLAARP